MGICVEEMTLVLTYILERITVQYSNKKCIEITLRMEEH